MCISLPALPAMSVACAVLCAVLSPAEAKEGTQDRPHFRTGLWRFERTIEFVRPAPASSTVFSKTEATRCADPNVAMSGIFSSPNVGTCRSDRPQVFGNQYVFPNRCDFLGPVTTVITVQSEAAYTEVNMLKVDPLPRRDVVVANRIGDCDQASSH